MPKPTQQLDVEGRKISVSNLDKVLYPGGRFTKGQVIDYYIRISPYILPHLKDRPVTLKRFPDGVKGEFFYEKDAPAYTPDWVKTVPVPRRAGGKPIEYILINDLPTLVWLANLANLEIHPFLHLGTDLQRPTAIAFDLDPGPGADVLTCCRVALLIRDVLSEIKLQSLVKVSGSKGLQMFVPLNSAADYAATQPFAKSLAESLESEHPDLVVSKMAKDLRAGKVFIDWSQNSDFKTTVSVYSLRAKADRPYVSSPITWDELNAALASGKADTLYFGPEAAIERAQRLGDLFAPVLQIKQKLPASTKRFSVPRPAENSKPAGDTRRNRMRNIAASQGGARRRSAKGELQSTPASLETYREKRDFAKTPEPPPSRSAPAPDSDPLPRRSAQGGRRRFVVQKHAASHLHYDFRLEMHDVLKSWAVPKGPPFALAERRLAMATEDHPIGYLSFEGIIPKGQYGGGTVMVWDIGTYELIEGNYYKGELRIFLDGKKLKGEWLLVRSRDDGERGKRTWYLIKTDAALPALSANRDDQSALTGRTMQQIADARDAEWQSNRPPREPASAVAVSRPASLSSPRTSSLSRSMGSERVRIPRGHGPDAARNEAQFPNFKSLPKAKLTFVEPMLAKLVSVLPEGAEWAYEVKLDGYRALAVKAKRKVTVYSRLGNVLNARFPLASRFGKLADNTILDGEIVVLDERGRPSFNALQNWHKDKRPLYYYAFDVLAYKGKDTRGLPFSERRRVLEQAVGALADPVRISESFQTTPANIVTAVRKQGLEGVVAKRLSSVYEAGRRSGAWVKFKTAQGQELVIGGYTPGSHGFDALLVGYYEGDRLIFIGKVRNGFTPALRRQVAGKFKGFETAKCPFANLPEPRSARRGKALTEEAIKECRWLKPKLVAQIEYTDWTAADHLRHSRFAGLRDDKNPREIVREAPA